MPTFGFESNSFGSTNISTPNPSAVNTTGNASQSIFGNLNSSTPSLIANTGNSPGPIFGTATNSTPTPFVVNTTGSASNSLFCNLASSAPKPPFAVNTNGNTSTSIFGNTSNSTPNPLGANTNGNTTSPSLSSHGFSWNGTSTGGFGTSPMASGFADGPTGISGSYRGLALHNSALGVGPIGNTTCGAMFGQPSNNIMTSGSDTGLASHNSSLRAGPFGNTPFGAFGQPSNNISGNKGPASPFTFPGLAAGPTGISGSHTELASHSSALGARPFGNTPSGPAFDHPSDNNTCWLPCPVITSDGRMTFPGISTSSDEPSASAGTATFEAQAHPSQIKGSKNFPYRTTECEDGSGGRLQSISGMRIYGSKSHEELRFEDSELNSRGSSSRFPPHFPDTNAAQNPFLRSQTPSTNSTTIFNQPSFPNPSSNLDTSSTTTQVFNNQFPSFPFPIGQSLNTTPIVNQPSSRFTSPFNFSTSSTNTSSVFNQPSPSFPVNNFFLNPTPSFNSTSSTTTSPVSNQPSPSLPPPLFPGSTSSFNFTSSSPTTPSIIQPSYNQNPTSIPSLTSAPSSRITWPALSGTINSQTNPAPSAWVGFTLTGNNGGSTSSTTTSSSFPINTSFPNPTPSTFNFYTTQYSFPPSFDQNPLSIPLLTSAATGNGQANLASSASTSTGDNGGSTGKTGDYIIAVREPVGSESATRRVEWLLYFSLVLIFVFVLIKAGF